MLELQGAETHASSCTEGYRKCYGEEQAYLMQSERECQKLIRG